METIAVDSLRKDISYTGDLIIDSSFILLPQSAQLSDGIIKALKDWGYENVLCEGNISLGGDIGLAATRKEEPKKKIKKNSFGLVVKSTIEELEGTPYAKSDELHLQMVEKVFNVYMDYIENVYTFYTTHKEIDEEDLSETIQQLCIFIKEHKRYILRINPTLRNSGKNFLVIHSMRTTVLALAIALQLHLPLSKMIELGKACILHEIGMLRLPPQLYMTEKKLSPLEKANISKHTLLGYQIVKDLNFPLEIQLGVLEHHEKENGTGYPRKITGEKISSIAKIISVACSYEAISSQRNYKEERSTFEAVVELIQNKNHQYDDAVIKALLYTVSLYPIGSYVYLSNRKVAIVIDSNSTNPRYPIVQLLTEKEADGSFKTIQTDEKGISIMRIMNKQEQEDILSLVKDKYEAIKQAQIDSAKNEAEALNKKGNTENNADNNKAESISVQNETEKVEEQPASSASESTGSSEGIEEVDISLFN